MTLLAVFSGIFGAGCGLFAGIVAGALAGPGGCCLGGVTGGTLAPQIGGDFPQMFVAPAFGLIAGFAMHRGVPVLPGRTELARAVYGSSLGTWPGWRR